MATNGKQDFAKFLSEMALKSEKANAATIDAIKAKVEKEQQDRIEREVMRVYEQIQRKVGDVRMYRKEIEKILASIKDLEKKATAILNGEID